MAWGECENPRPECPYASRPTGCFSDVHHKYFPKNVYLDVVGSSYRELPQNKEQKCRWDHEELHKVEDGPEKPEEAQMLGEIALSQELGLINLSKYKLRQLGLEE